MPARQELSLQPRVGLVFALLAAAGWLCLSLRGSEGLLFYVALWVVALPILLAPLRAALWRELPGALFVFLTAARADDLDDVLGLQQRVSLALVLLSFIYLALHRKELLEVVRSPFAVWLGIFFVQQIANVYLLKSPDAASVWQGRTSVFAALLAGAVLTRRPDGERLFPMLLILAVLVSLPVMGFELAHPGVRLFTLAEDGHGRAGGMFDNPNEVGSVLAFAIVCVLTLRLRGALSRTFGWWLGGACALGLLICASRSAFAAVLLVLALYAWGRAVQRSERAPIATTAIGLGIVLLLLPLLGPALVAASRNLKTLGFENTDRLDEVVLAIAGSPDELEEDDSSRIDIAMSAVQLIGERPLFGFGSGNFSVMDKEGRHSHMEFLEVMGENGLVGILLYAGVWMALLTVVRRTDPEYRLGALLLVGAWFVIHFASHNLVVYRYYMLPMAYVCGLSGIAPRPESRLRPEEPCQDL